MNPIDTATTLFARYEDEVASLDVAEIVSGLRDLQFQTSQVGEDNYAAMMVDLTEKGLRNLYALAKFEEAITIYRAKLVSPWPDREQYSENTRQCSHDGGNACFVKHT